MSNNLLRGPIRKPSDLPAPVLGCSKFVFCILPIAKIVIGSVYLNDCPQQHYIPIYLIVMGVFGLMLGVLACLPCAQNPQDGTTNQLSIICTSWNSLASFFVFCWFIAGNVWIYSIYEPNYIKTNTTTLYCNRTVYLFAFWTTTLGYILLLLFLFIGCCVLICFCKFTNSENLDDNV